MSFRDKSMPQTLFGDVSAAAMIFIYAWTHNSIAVLTGCSTIILFHVVTAARMATAV